MDVKERTFPRRVKFALPSLIGWMVGLAGLEPATPRLSSVCSNQLSYRPSQITGGCRSGYPQGSMFRVILWWRHADSNRRHSACKADALPTELYPLSGRCELRREKIKLCAAILDHADFLVVFRCSPLRDLQPQTVMTRSGLDLLQ
jgi:hypothetical protein